MKDDQHAAIITPANVAWIRRLLGPHVRRTPLLPSRLDRDVAAGRMVFLKCENLQITGSFKLRGALGALLGYREGRPDVWRRIEADGVVTGSTGNFALGLAHATALLGLDCTVIVHAEAAHYKVAEIARVNPRAKLVQVPYERWREMMVSGTFPELPGFFLSSETDPFVSLGNATIAMETLEDLPDMDAILVPYGGGNLVYSIASLLRQVKPDVGVCAVEIETGAPLSASFRAGKPVEVEYTRSFVDGIGATFVIPAQFHRLRGELRAVFTVTTDEIADALSFLALSEKVIAEGAGAAALAAALRYTAEHGWESPCCVVSGGVISPATFHETLEGVASSRRGQANAAVTGDPAAATGPPEAAARRSVEGEAYAE